MLEDVRQKVGRNADAGVSEDDFDFAVGLAQNDFDCAVCQREFDSVGRQVLND